MYLCVTPERYVKTTRLMAALKNGAPGKADIVYGAPPPDNTTFVVWGQLHLTLKIVPPALRSGRPFWVIDNGYWKPARGTAIGYYRLTYCSMSPVLLPTASDRRTDMRPLKLWRAGHPMQSVLLGMPGLDFGLAVGLNVRAWAQDIEQRIRAQTSRRIVVRMKNSPTPLERELDGAWALVTHSSNVAVDAILAGVPVFVAPTNPAAPVGRTDLEIEWPVKPERYQWLCSLSCQQFTLDEMRSGEAQYWMNQIKEVYDGKVQHSAVQQGQESKGQGRPEGKESGQACGEEKEVSHDPGQVDLRGVRAP